MRRGLFRTAQLVGRRIKCRVCGLVQKVPQPAPPVPGAGVYPLAADHASMRSFPQEPRSKPARRRLSSRWIEGFHDFAGARSHLQELSILLILLSSADIFMTYVLLRTSPRFHESNPVAQWIFQRWNIAGMVVFKFASIGTAIAIGEFVERRRPVGASLSCSSAARRRQPPFGTGCGCIWIRSDVVDKKTAESESPRPITTPRNAATGLLLRACVHRRLRVNAASAVGRWQSTRAAGCEPAQNLYTASYTYDGDNCHG